MESRIAFQIRPLSDSKPATVDFLPAPPDFRDAQLFHDLSYICGAGGFAHKAGSYVPVLNLESAIADTQPPTKI